MIKPEIPVQEAERLNALEEYRILDTLPEKEFDDITKIASQICQTPISLISLIDDKRQWFKSHHGLDATETPRDVAFCAHAINNQNQVLIVPDSRNDERFSDNPLVTGEPHVIFYTGVPLVSPEGFALGTLCVIDSKPKVLTEDQLDSLKSLANQVIRLFELRKSNTQLQLLQQSLQEQNKELERFTYVVSHDIKSPLANIISFSELIQTEHAAQLDEQGLSFLGYINQSAYKLKDFVDGILLFYRGEDPSDIQLDELNFTDFMEYIVRLLDVPKEQCQFNYPKDSVLLKVSRSALEQIFINLITNAIKYNNKEEIKIDISLSQDEENYFFKVSDNGMGIEKENQEKIFELFKNLSKKDRYGNYGTGMGLATVKKIIDKNGGSIELESEINRGSTFSFSLKKRL